MLPSPTPYLATGTRVDRYVVEGLLGEGSSAAVYQSRDRRGTAHALKLLRTPTGRVRRKLLREGRVQSVLRHPNVLAVTEVLQLGDDVALVLELVNGASLAHLLQRRPLTVPMIDDLAAGIFAGVAHTHSQGLVHRDLKPDNVLLEVRGRRVVPKVADFGLVKDAEPEPDDHQGGVSMGTPRFMAPEQIRDAGNVDHRADLWSIGCLLYTMVTHQAPFSPDDDDLLAIFGAVIQGERVPVQALRVDVPERMVRAIDAALTVDPRGRPADVEALARIWWGDQPVPPPLDWPEDRLPRGQFLTLDDEPLSLITVGEALRPSLRSYTRRPVLVLAALLWTMALLATALLVLLLLPSL